MSPVIVFYGIGACLALFNVLFSIEQCVADFSNALLVQPACGFSFLAVKFFKCLFHLSPNFSTFLSQKI